MPSTTIIEEKAALRRWARERMAGLDGRARRESDEALFAGLLALPQLQGAGTVLLYHGMGAEPETARLLDALLDRGKAVALPRCLPGHGMEARLVGRETRLVRHPYGMLEPGEDCPVAAREEIGLILVPGLCFDKFCYRLGRGGGYYDRYLEGYGGVAAALCRDCLLVDEAPREPHDRRMDLVVTESRVLPDRG